MKKSKILYFVSEEEYFLTHKLDQAKSAIKNKFDVLLVCKFCRNEKKIKSLGFKTKNLNFNRKSINPFRELICIVEFYKIVLNFKPNIIQSIALKPILYTSLISPFLKDIKMIMCVVGLGYLFIDKKLSTKVIKILYLNFINFFLKKENSHFVFQNNEDKKTIGKNINFTKSNISIIKGSGIDTNKFIKEKKITKVYDLIFHSRILYDKGFYELIQAIKKLKKKRTLSVLILGSTDLNNRSAVELEKIKGWQKQGLIKWKKKTSNVIPYIRRSRIAILPSYREGLPKTLLEAASCELPIITSDTVGCREICIHMYNGILVPLRDHVLLSQAIERLLDNKSLSDLLGKNGRKLVKKKFSKEIVEKGFLNIYRKYI
jgi:glycosyltransferase involved in cell wall biosynthesis